MNSTLPAGADRRRHQRFNTWLDSVVHDMRTGDVTPATLVDISAGGASIRSKAEFPAGTPLNIAVRWGQRPFSVLASVVAKRDADGAFLAHVTFTGGAPGTHDALTALLRHLEGNRGTANQRVRRTAAWGAVTFRA